MNSHWWVLALLVFGILLASAGALAQENIQITVHLVDAQNKQHIGEALITTKILDKETNKVLTITEYAADNEITLLLPSQASFEIVVDVLSTEGKDYFIKKQAKEVTNGQELELLPIASIDVVVVDRLDNRLADAALSVTCDKDYGLIYPEMTDKYGSALILVPVGECTISAEREDQVKTETIKLNRGEQYEVQIKVVDRFFSIFFVITVIAVLGGGSFVVTSMRKKEPTTQPLQEKVEELPARASSILKTLNERECLVVQHLLENKTKSTQARIRHATRIPKTSLARALDMLKRKGVLTYERNGIIKNVTLTPWFLDRENEEPAKPAENTI